MVFPLGAVLAAAPGVISAAADIIRVIKKKKTNESQPIAEKLDELEELIERQAELIEELARNNNNLALAVKNNRIVSSISVALAVSAIALALWP